jgi:rare lipoprotein A
LCLGLLTAFGSLAAVAPESARAQTRHVLRGIASWYGRVHHGRRTASGVRFDMHALTAAHRTLPFGTRLRVTHVRSGRFVDVVVNDRGPYVGARIIDLSRMAAVRLGMLRDGLGEVRLEILAVAPSGGGTATEDEGRPADRRWQAKLAGGRGDVTAFEASLDARPEDRVLR